MFVIACSDHWTIEATRISQRPQGSFSACLPESDVIDRFVDKAGFAALLASTGVPHPSTAFARSEHDVRDMAAKSRGELFLKPTNSQRFHQKFGKKAFRIEDVERAVEIFNKAREAGLEVLVQEYIPESVGSALLRRWVRRPRAPSSHGVRAARFRMFPPDFGNSSFMVSVGIEEVAGRRGQRSYAVRNRAVPGDLLRGIQARRARRQVQDPRSQRRPWWYIQFAAECGWMSWRSRIVMRWASPCLLLESTKLGFASYFPIIIFRLLGMREVEEKMRGSHMCKRMSER